jgi:hypothetical protein
MNGGEGSMHQDFDSSACVRAQDAIDITAIVHYRMVPESAREALKTRRRLSKAEESAVFRRLFPSIREEAQLRFLAGSGRGVVVCSAHKIQYLPEGGLSKVLRNVSGNAKRNLRDAIGSYDPLSEAVVVIKGKRFSKLLIAGAESFPEGLRA